MRVLILVSAVILLGGCAASDSAPADTASTTTNVPATGGSAMNGYRVLASGSYGAAASSNVEGRRAPWVEVATDPASYRSLWQTHVSPQEPPPVDFTRESAVFLLLGPRSTGGYSIQPKGVRLESESVVVDADLREPDSGTITTQAFTAPYSVIAVSQPQVRNVEWNNQGRLLATFQPEP